MRQGENNVAKHRYVGNVTLEPGRRGANPGGGEPLCAQPSLSVSTTERDVG